jgi:uracil-DNA glycosylase family 4
MTRNVPNQFPTLDGGVAYRIALIGEAPGADEVVAGRPFVGMSGRWLDYLLNRVGILRSACFLGNVCQVRPPNNDLERFDWNGSEIQDGLGTLKVDLDSFRPNLCVLLGGSALRAAKGYPESITKWRGSLFNARDESPFEFRKCLGTFHPASSLRVYEQTPLLLFDLKRARKEGEFGDLRIPQRDIKVLDSVGEVQLTLRRLREQRLKIGTDIEGYVNNLTCISFADDPLRGYVIPFIGPSGNFWQADDEYVVWTCIKDLLEDPTVSKVLQNGLYDRFVLAYTYGILVRGVTDDTMLKGWECYCELEKALSVQASIYTKEPYYKDERDTHNFDEFYNYNGKDSCVTLEISNHQDGLPELRGRSREHYKFNVEMQEPLLYMELRGLGYVQHEARRTAAEVRAKVNVLQQQINKVAGCELKVETAEQFRTLVRDVMCYKKTPPNSSVSDMLLSYYRKPFYDALNKAITLADQGFPFDDARNGEFSRLLECHMNTDSPPQMQNFLYTLLDLPVQLHRKTKQPTTDALSIIRLFKLCEKSQEIYKAAVLKNLLHLSSLLTQLQTLEILCDPDGRVRCAYNVVGSVTGRLSCSKSPTRSGYNLQTVTKKQRRLFRPDPDHWLWQCDLSGADGYTVAAHCKRLGDPTMLDDYTFGLKPAKIIARMYAGVNIARLTRDEIKVECQKVDPSGWLYMACKRVQHGSSYGMGKLTMSNQILEDSWKYSGEVVYVPPATCEALKILFFQRYPGITVWHRWISEQLKNTRSLTSANGHTRKFFGRPNDHDTLKQAFSDEPQNVTTYVTNCAVLKLWNDAENRREDGSLTVEPLHQIHDAVVGQFPKDQSDWSLGKIRTAFDNRIVIAGESLVIPFEGAYGESWGPEDLVHPI